MTGHRLSLIGVLAATALAGCAGPRPGATEPKPTASASPAAALDPLRYTCGGHPFTLDVLDQRAGAEGGDHPAAMALRMFLAESHPEAEILPDEGWLLVGLDEQEASFIARVEGDPPFVEAAAARAPGGWRVRGWGQCRPRAAFDGANGATWVFDPNVPPAGPSDRRFSALVTEVECASGRSSEGRVLPPVIVYRPEEILVAFAVRPPRGDAGDCQSNPATRVVVELDEPIAGRRLVDAGVFPPHDPTHPWPPP